MWGEVLDDCGENWPLCLRRQPKDWEQPCDSKVIPELPGHELSAMLCRPSPQSCQLQMTPLQGTHSATPQCVYSAVNFSEVLTAKRNKAISPTSLLRRLFITGEPHFLRKLARLSLVNHMVSTLPCTPAAVTGQLEKKLVGLSQSKTWHTVIHYMLSDLSRNLPLINTGL